MDDPIRLLLILIPALPLAAAVLIGLLGPRVLRQQSHWLAIAAVLASFLCSLLLMRELSFLQRAAGAGGEVALGIGYEEVRRLWTWTDVADAYQQPRTPPGESRESLVGGGSRDFRIDIVLRADSLTCMMLVMVTLIATLVAIYSAGYMHGDPGYWRFFAYFGLFVFSMTMLVSVSNFVLLYVFWEAVGLCSYLLIGFWYQKPAAAAAGKKAFLVNRVGDFGFALGVFLIWTTYGTLNFHDSLRGGELEPARIQQAVAAERAGEVVPAEQEPVAGVFGPLRLADNELRPAGQPRTSAMISLAICLLLLLGACGKSAQFPLHVWLPDAMEGPTPVSALIHAATMVTAGIYMIARCTPLFLVSPDAQLVVSVVGGFTALLAALIALTQYDLKRVLAYSTVSQLGYMFLALGVGSLAGVTAGMFHLFTHAFFKALLFLGAGSVMHAMGNVIDMRRFGGLRRVMPVTYITFAVGCLALAGVFPLAGFWSKDAVLGAVHDKVHELEPHDSDSHGPAPHGPAPHGPAPHDSSPHGSAEGGGTQAVERPESSADDDVTPVFGLSNLLRGQIFHWLYLLGLMTSFLTAFYTFRAFYLTFHGPELIPPEAGRHAHESPASMTVPLGILAVCSALVGLLLDRSYLDGTNSFANWLLWTPSLGFPAAMRTTLPGEFHLSVAGWSTLMALGGIGLSSYLYLGSRHEIHGIRQFFDLAWVSGWSDVESFARMRQWRVARWVRECSAAVGLEWLLRLVVGALLLVVLVLSAPLLLLYYVSPYKLSYHRFYLDELYELVLVRPLRGLARLCYGIDRWLIDGTVNFVGRVPRQIGDVMRSLQMGLVPFYALAMVLGLLILLAVQLLG
ncbi:MAG: NADH-quinone oxidoreductase subunit L [Pirellulaceae bacterium]|nr:NADH-quinone oxidoreductase subunit L [Pirellulaceae bacterium]